LKKTTFSFRVRYGETDKMGVVYHGNYAQYLELGRTEWLREMGFSYKWMEENGVMLPVVNLNLNYKKSARYDDELIVTTSLRKIPTYRIEFDYEIRNKDGVVLVTAETTLVFINTETNKLMKAPQYLLEKLE
jgi:acyl-CoA thioester hydrolase